MERVALKTDHLNERSQAAIAALGATREGRLRHHVRRTDGSWRDSVYFSVLREEWPAVRSRLEARLRRG
jgi:RimJ/RimL family protein N-acetyltransferase